MSCKNCLHVKVCKILEKKKVFEEQFMIDVALSNCLHHLSVNENYFASLKTECSKDRKTIFADNTLNALGLVDEPVILNPTPKILAEPIYCPSCEMLKEKTEFKESDVCHICHQQICESCLIIDISSGLEHKLCEKCWEATSGGC